MKNRSKQWAGIALVVYLLIVGVVAVFLLITNFPVLNNETLIFPEKGSGARFFEFLGTKQSSEQGLIWLGFFAGLAGSFLHAAQSLASYIGNEEFEPSWSAWYFLRPWIGGILGFTLYFALRAGFVNAVDALNPYGVVALGLLGGWFSKTTTDKLQDVFETLFKTNADAKRKDKLQANDRPLIEGTWPEQIQPGNDELRIYGRGFSNDCIFLLQGQEVNPEFISANELLVSLKMLEPRPAQVALPARIKNKQGREPLSQGFEITFA